MDRRERLERARLYLITEARPGGSDPVPLLEAALRGGVDVVQLREKELSDREVLAAGHLFRRLCDAYGALLIVDDRPDLAVLCGADGVHLGQDDVPVMAARRVVGPELVIGLSTHSPADLEAAAGADYLGVGPVFATPTKPGRPAVGLELVRVAAERARTPWFAIGGIDATNAAEVVAAGATRLAAVRAIRDAHDPEAAARALRAVSESPSLAR